MGRSRTWRQRKVRDSGGRTGGQKRSNRLDQQEPRPVQTDRIVTEIVSRPSSDLPVQPQGEPIEMPAEGGPDPGQPSERSRGTAPKRARSSTPPHLQQAPLDLLRPGEPAIEVRPAVPFRAQRSALASHQPVQKEDLPVPDQQNVPEAGPPRGHKDLDLLAGMKGRLHAGSRHRYEKNPFRLTSIRGGEHRLEVRDGQPRDSEVGGFLRHGRSSLQATHPRNEGIQTGS